MTAGSTNRTLLGRSWRVAIVSLTWHQARRDEQSAFIESCRISGHPGNGRGLDVVRSRNTLNPQHHGAMGRKQLRTGWSRATGPGSSKRRTRRGAGAGAVIRNLCINPSGTTRPAVVTNSRGNRRGIPALERPADVTSSRSARWRRPAASAAARCSASSCSATATAAAARCGRQLPAEPRRVRPRRRSRRVRDRRQAGTDRRRPADHDTEWKPPRALNRPGRRLPAAGVRSWMLRARAAPAGRCGRSLFV